MEDWISIGDTDTEYQDSINETNDNNDILNMINCYNNEIEDLDSTIVKNENKIKSDINKKVFFDQTIDFRFDMYTHIKIVLYQLKELYFFLRMKFCL